MLEVTEQRPMNNEYANSGMSKLSPVTLNNYIARKCNAINDSI